MSEKISRLAAATAEEGASRARGLSMEDIGIGWRLEGT
jgi:hypothetical protein